MDIRIRAESLRPVKYLRSHRQRDRALSLDAGQGQSWPESAAGDAAAQDAARWRQAARAAGSAGGSRIAIIGMGCRFPDADDPVALLDVVLTGRRAFRRLPPGRLELADYYSADRSAPDATYSARAALIEGWQFDRAAFGVPEGVYRAVDPAQWLALETAARALAAAGFVAGEGLARNRTGVVIGNSLNGDWSRAAAMRLRWPYVRRVFADALAAGAIPAQYALPVLGYAKQRYLEPFPVTTDETLSGSMPAAIAARICGYFGFRGGGYAVDGSQASSLLAVASACSALASGDLDVAVAGGVDLGLDPLELVGLAKTGVLARGDMRVYDENPTGYLPGEGCGMVVLMRSPDARAAGLPVYAEIAGWGTSSGLATGTVPDSRSQFLALHRAYHRAGIAPGDVQLIEGHGAGTAGSDTTELSALAELRSDAGQVAALGSVKANIGNTKAAAGVASLIKAVLAMSTGLIPPATGFSRPHPLVRGGEAALRLPRAPQPWPEGPRIAGVSAMGPGIDVHLVLHSEPTRGRHERKHRVVPAGSRAGAGAAEVAAPLIGGPSRSAAFLLHAPDRDGLATLLARIAQVAPWLSDSELGDLACQLARDAASQGPARVALVASSQDHLARLASQAAALLPRLPGELLTLRPGIYAADGADGRVTLMFSDAGEPKDRPGQTDPAAAGNLLWPLSVLRWLDKLGVSATAAVGCSRGEIAGLVWAGCLTEADAAAFAADRAMIMNAALTPGCPAQPGSGAGEQASAGDPPSADHASLLGEAARRLTIVTPRRRLVSAGLGREVRSADDIVELLSASADRPDGLEAALRTGAVGATLLLETGPGHVLAKAATAACRVPAASLGAGSGADAAHTAAALFAAGALEHPGEVFEGRPSRPFDLWREQTFIGSPVQATPAIRGPKRAAVPAARHSPAQQPARPSESGPTAEPVPAPGRTPEDSRTPGPTPAPEHPSTSEAAPVPEPSRGAQTGPAAEPAAATGPGRVPVRQAAPGVAPSPRRVPDLARHAAAPATQPDQSAPAAGGGPAQEPWARCYAEELRPADDVVPPGDDRPWRVRAATAKTFGLSVRKLFRDDPAAGRVLAIAGDPLDPDAASVVLTAALDAIASGTLVLVTHGPGFSGFCASLHAEHPELGITVLRVPPSAQGLRLARKFAAAEPGRFRELVIGPDALPRTAVMTPAPVPGSGGFPLGPDDVVIVTRSGTGAELALAQVLGCCGAAIGIVGRVPPDGAPQADAALERLASAGVRMAVQDADLGDQDDLTSALRSIERQFGPVTALAHPAGPAGPRPVAGLSEDDLRGHLSAGASAIDRLADAIGGAPRLRLILTFGSVAGRYGLAGAGLQALAGAALAESAQRVASGIEGCRALHVDWPGWAEQDPGPQEIPAGELSSSQASAIGVEQGSRLLLKALATQGLPARVAIHGRVGVPEPPAIAAAGCTPPSGRFVEYVRVDYPGVELVCDARLSLRTDPYLSDHRLYGMAMLPAAIALEAMAQAAAAVAGHPLRQLTAVSMDAPVVVPAHNDDAHALIRIRAVADGSCVTAVLRCAESGFATDHFRATFRPADDPPAAAAPSLAGLPELDEMPASDSGIVDGTELYGPVCFQSGRFRRVALVPEVTSRSCRALVRGGDGQHWFGEGAADADASLVLGSPGLNDATWHVLQACVPHRRLLPAGCESVIFSGREADGAVEIRAVQTAMSASAAAGPEYVWDAEAIDAAGQPLVTWRGLRLADAGPLSRNGAWPPSLLSVYLERSAVALGLHPELRVALQAGRPDSAAAAPAPAASVPQPSPPADAQRSPSPAPAGDRRPSPSRERAAPGNGELSGFTLSVRAPGSAACGWDTAGPEVESGRDLSPDLAALEAELLRRGEQPAIARARLRALSACLAGLGPLARPPVIAGSAQEADWLVLRAGAATLACAIVEMSGVSSRVAIAIMTSDRKPVPAQTEILDRTKGQGRVADRTADPREAADQRADPGRAADLAGSRGGSA